jgi:hypothetical protein
MEEGSLTPLPLYRWGYNPQHTLNNILGEAQSRYGSCVEEKHHFPLPRIEPRILGRFTRIEITVRTALPWVTNPRSPYRIQSMCCYITISFQHGPGVEVKIALSSGEANSNIAMKYEHTIT